MTVDKTSLLQTIEETTRGLLYPSESDFPITPYSYGEQEPTVAALLERCGLPADSPFEETTLAFMFEGFMEVDEYSSEKWRKQAERFRSLWDLLEKNLDDVRVFRLGEVDMEVFVLGRHPCGTWLGFRTNVVET